jgi:hypothetical protein
VQLVLEIALLGLGCDTRLGAPRQKVLATIPTLFLGDKHYPAETGYHCIAPDIEDS